MQEYINEITSDSTITSVVIEKDTTSIEFKLYTGSLLTIKFNNVEAVQLLPQWKYQDIEGIKILNNSVLLGEEKKQLVEDEEKADGLKCFQVIGNSGNVVVEVIAYDFQIV